MLCDQPFVTTNLINTLIETRKGSGKSIVASSYANTYGPPALFDRAHFEALGSLKGDSGARNIMKQFSEDMTILDFPDGASDIDTLDDWKAFNTAGRFPIL
jgi:molybdenum cofactor cytidylyltransferase